MAGMRFSAMKSVISFRLLNINVSDASNAASGRVSFNFVSAFSMSAALWISTTSIFTPSFSADLRAVSKLNWFSGLAGFARIVTCNKCGTASLGNSRRLLSSSTFSAMNPVRFASGRARLEIRPMFTTSPAARNRRGGALGGKCGRAAPNDQDVHRHRHEFGSECGKTIIATFSVSILDEDIFALDPAQLAQPFAKPLHGRERLMG